MQFDYVIVGGGSAGSVLASRLSEDASVSVCLIESGGPGKSFFIRTPAMAAVMIPGKPKIHNWAFRTEPQRHLNNRRCYQPRGRALGGSSAINAMLYVRGHPGDYDEWADLGADGWDWESVRPWFLHAENSLHPMRRPALSWTRRDWSRFRRTTISTATGKRAPDCSMSRSSIPVHTGVSGVRPPLPICIR